MWYFLLKPRGATCRIVAPRGKDLMPHKPPHLATSYHKICGTTFRQLAPHFTTFRHLPPRGAKILNEAVPQYLYKLFFFKLNLPIMNIFKNLIFKFYFLFLNILILIFNFFFQDNLLLNDGLDYRIVADKISISAIFRFLF